MGRTDYFFDYEISCVCCEKHGFRPMTNWRNSRMAFGRPSNTNRMRGIQVLLFAASAQINLVLHSLYRCPTISLSLCQVSSNFAQHRMQFHTVHMHHMGNKTIWIDESNALRSRETKMKVPIGPCKMSRKMERQICFVFVLFGQKIHIDAMWIRVFVFNKHNCVLRAHVQCTLACVSHCCLICQSRTIE